MSAQRLHERIEDYQRATRQLAKALARPLDEFMRDSVIQRFEVAYELAWKMLKLRLEQEGVAAGTPRQVLQAALRPASSPTATPTGTTPTALLPQARPRT